MLSSTVDALKAIAEPTRLRILAVMGQGDVTVTDLTEILGQSQPRVSRHLRVLVEAGLAIKHREGTWAFFRPVDTGDGATLVRAALDAADASGDPTLAGDRQRLAVVRARRAETALEYFERIAPIWDEERALHAPDDVEAALLAALGDGPLGDVLDVGTGTGRMLQLLADRCARAVGLDTSHSMLSVARANLEGSGASNWELRQGDVHSPPWSTRSFDLVIIHQVLHYLDDASSAVGQAARLVRPGGRLLVVDFAPHDHEALRTVAHRRLGFTHDQLRDWLDASGFDCSAIVDVDPPAGTDGLTVTVWLGQARTSLNSAA